MPADNTRRIRTKHNASAGTGSASFWMSSGRCGAGLVPTGAWRKRSSDSPAPVIAIAANTTTFTAMINRVAGAAPSGVPEAGWSEAPAESDRQPDRTLGHLISGSNAICGKRLEPRALKGTARRLQAL